MTIHRAARDRGFPQGPDRLALPARAADEFALTTVLLLLVVTVGRWLRDPGSILYMAALPGHSIAPYVLAQLAGSAADW